MPCLYSMHGGGYVIGTYAMDDPTFDRLCPKLGLVGRMHGRGWYSRTTERFDLPRIDVADWPLRAKAAE